MIELFIDKKDCCGCGACVNLCPQHAITLKSNFNAFLYPSIDSTRCIGCNACTHVCPISNTVTAKKPKQVYAATYKEKELLSQSSSGGIFPALAMHILTKGGVVFGTSLDETFSPSVTSIENIEQLFRLQGSKYVQSNTGNSYNDMKTALSSGKTVLFCGTPCQVAAVKRYSEGKDSNLYLIDIVCHGVPSAQLFKDYIRHLEHRQNIRITGFTFRDKKYGQDNYFSYTYIKDGRHSYYCNRAARSSYYRLFLNKALFRESCYHCKFASTDRVGDLSICDYWGIESEHPKFSALVKSKKLCGISGVLVNTTKGEVLFEQIKPNLLTAPSTFAQISKHNSQLLMPSAPSSDREEVFRLYRTGGYQAVDDYYFKKYRLNILKGNLGSILPLSLRKKINGLIRRNR